jgi:predicted nucleic acid-binding protein
MLLDSNIVIYAALPEYVALRRWIAEHGPAVSAISYVEVLGYHRLTPATLADYQQFFMVAKVFPLDQPVLDKAIRLRQLRKMDLGDSLIAATALVNRRVLITHNTKDFEWVPDLNLLDPLSSGIV